MPALTPQLAVRALVVALLFSGGVPHGRAASFSAEMVDTERDATHTSVFHFREGSYRYEVVENGATVVIIHDAAGPVTRLLQTAEKQFLELGPDAPLSRMADPFAFYAYYARTKAVQPVGTEAIDGVPCTKQEVAADGQLYCTAWMSQELGVPLKIEIPLFQRTVELRRITRDPQDAALFAVPAGYSPAPPPEEFRQPDWAGQVAGAPEVSAPFERTLDAGNILRVRPKAGQHLHLEVSNPGPDPCTFTAVAFKAGRALSDPSYETCTLEAEQSVGMTLTKGPDVTDALVMRTRAGKAKIKASWIAAAGTNAQPPAAVAPDIPAEVGGPAEADIASRFLVSWGGPGAAEDYLTVARPNQPPGAYLSMTRLREGNPLKLWAPSEPGDYEIRYILGRGTKVLARAPIKIHDVPASVAAAGPAKVAGWIEVTWTGPAADGDYVSVARPGQPPGASLGLVRVKDGNPLRLRAPSDPGEHELRYVLARGTRVLATAPVTIEAVAASVEAPATVVAGAEFAVAWTGPGYNEDFVSIARPNQPPGAYAVARVTRQGNPAKLKAPKEPGEYEVRYILGRGPRLLTKVAITVTAPP